MLVLAEFRVQRIRTYFDFLDTKWGRGWFILFIALLVLENDTALEICLSIATIIIALVNMVLGWNQGSDGKEAQLKRDQAAKAKASGQLNPDMKLQQVNHKKQKSQGSAPKQ